MNVTLMKKTTQACLIIMPTICSCCCHGIKHWLSFSSLVVRKEFETRERLQFESLCSILSASACQDSQTTHAASRYTWPAAQIWPSMPLWRWRGLESIYTWSLTGGTWHSVLQLIVTRRLRFPWAHPHSGCCCLKRDHFSDGGGFNPQLSQVQTTGGEWKNKRTKRRKSFLLLFSKTIKNTWFEPHF